MADNPMPTNDNDRAASSNLGQARSSIERSQAGPPASPEMSRDEREAQEPGSQDRRATPGRKPLFRK